MTVVATDTFTRADGGLGANWATITDIGVACRIVSNAVDGGVQATDQYGKYTAADTGAADHYSQADITIGTSTTQQEAGLFVRMTNVGTNTNGYAGYSPAYNFGNYAIYSCAGSGFTQLAATGTAPLGTGTRTLKLEAVGSTLTLYENGVSKLSTTDATYGGTQRNTGIHVYWDTSGVSADVKIDNFEIGTPSAAAAPVAKQRIRTPARLRASTR